MMRLVVFFSLCVFSSFPLYSEEDHGDGVFSASTKGGTRLSAQGKLSDRAVSFLSTFFSIPSETIRAKYNTVLPDAVENAIQNKDESSIAAILAKLFAQINPQQAETLIEAATKELKAEAETDEKKDARYIALMERLKWGAMVRIDKPIEKAEAKPFVEAFQKEFDKLKEWNKEANTQLKLAADGNAKAKEWVRKRVNMSGILNFAEGQKKSGNEEAATKAIKAVSFKEGNQNVLDMFGKGPEAQRLFLGESDESAKNAINRFLDNKKTFGNNYVPSQKHASTPEKSWYLNEAGEFTKGAPKGFEPKQVAKTKVTPPSPTSSPTSPSANADIAPLENIVQSQACMGCHNQIKARGTSLTDPNLGIQAEAGKEFVPLSYVLNMLQGTSNMANNVPEDVKSQLRKFQEIHEAGTKK